MIRAKAGACLVGGAPASNSAVRTLTKFLTRTSEEIADSGFTPPTLSKKITEDRTDCRRVLAQGSCASSSM